MSQSQPQLHSTEPNSAHNAHITASSAPPLELRQNDPQDCSNLIAASVDRATVEISRTIIALNATFSQQLQQASISASNGIKSAENSASSSISIVSQNASSATSSASFSLNLANLAVTSVNSVLANANIALASAQSQIFSVNLILTSALSASTSDIVRLSSSLSSLEATLVSVKASASTAVASAVMSQQSLKDTQGTVAISLAPMQLAGIVLGTMIASLFLSFSVGFVLIRVRKEVKNKETSTANIKEPDTDLKRPLSRADDSVFFKFSPPTSLHSDAPFLNTKVNTQKPSTPRLNEWPQLDHTADLFGPQIVPHGISASAAVSCTTQLALDHVEYEDSRIEFTSPPKKSVVSTFAEDTIIAEAYPDPAKQPVFTSRPMHRLAGNAGREFEIVGAFHEMHLVPQESIFDKSFKDSVEPPFGKPEQASRETLVDHGSCKDPIDQHKTVWKDANEASLDEGSEGRSARKDEDLTLKSAPSPPVFVKTQGLTEQSDITIKRKDSHYREIRRSEPVQDRRPPEIEARGTESTYRTSSSLRQNTFVDVFKNGVELQSAATPKSLSHNSLTRFSEVERELSPLRRNPPFEAITLLLARQQEDAKKLTNDGVDEHESRGRSMIRTSDILESRTSGLAQTKKSQDQTLQQRGRQAEPGDSCPTSSGSVPHQLIRGTPDSRQTSPKQEPVAITQELCPIDSLSIATDSYSRSVSVASAGVTAYRDDSSPHRRDTSGIGPDPRPIADAKPTASGNAKEFSQNLSKFQTLATQDAILASSEVTSRAIAGIYIPGSLREQAVRSLSKSRERAAGERKRK